MAATKNLETSDSIETSNMLETFNDLEAINNPENTGILETTDELETVNELDSRIQALPQELQDTILCFTSGFQISANVAIEKSYQPPVALQLNRKLRAKFNKEYYGGASFTVALLTASDFSNFVLDYEYH